MTPPSSMTATPTAALRVVTGAGAATMNGETGAALGQALALAEQDVDLAVEQRAGGAVVIAAALCAPADVVLIDAHGHPYKDPPVIAGLALDPARLQDLGADGIQAPVLLIGCCWTRGPLIAEALRRCLARPTAVLIASTHRTQISHAQRVYPDVLRTVARLGPNPDPAEAYEVLRGLDVLQGDAPVGWGATLCRRRAETDPLATAPGGQF